MVLGGEAGAAPRLAGISAAELKSVNAALAADNKVLTAKLKAHITADHLIDKSAVTTNDGNWVFGNGLGYGLDMGSDSIVGGLGNDVIVGDTALMQQPNMLTGWTSKQAKSVADGLQASFLKTVDRLPKPVFERRPIQLIAGAHGRHVALEHRAPPSSPALTVKGELNSS